MDVPTRSKEATLASRMELVTMACCVVDYACAEQVTEHWMVDRGYDWVQAPLGCISLAELYNAEPEMFMSYARSLAGDPFTAANFRGYQDRMLRGVVRLMSEDPAALALLCDLVKARAEEAREQGDTPGALLQQVAGAAKEVSASLEKVDPFKLAMRLKALQEEYAAKT